MDIPRNDTDYIGQLSREVLAQITAKGYAYIGCEVFNSQYDNRIVARVAKMYADAGYFAKVNYRFSNGNVFSLEVAKTPLRAIDAKALYSSIFYPDLRQ